MDEIKYQKLEEELKKVVRRQDEIQKSVDLLFQDRAILEDLQASVTGLKEIILANQQHQDMARNSVQADINEVTNTMKELTDNTVIVKSPSKGLFNKLSKIFKREEVK